MKHWQIGLFIWMVFLLMNCQSDTKKEKIVSTLNGNWILVEGYREGKKTESLNDTYFTFSEDKMSTNLPIKGAIDSPYIRVENMISQTIINDIKIDYTIDTLTEKDLTLSTNLRGLDFTFILKREK